MVFYNPIRMDLNGLPAIVYPSKGAETVFERKGLYMSMYLKRLLDAYDLKKPETEYMLAITWEDKGHQMTDIWLFDPPYEFGAQARARIFKGMLRVTNKGEGCENGLIVLGREAEHRKGPDGKRSMPIEQYLRERPQLPEWLKVGEDFYLIK